MFLNVFENKYAYIIFFSLQFILFFLIWPDFPLDFIQFGEVLL